MSLEIPSISRLEKIVNLTNEKTCSLLLSNKFCSQRGKGRQLNSRHYTNKFEKFEPVILRNFQMINNRTFS